MTNGLQNQSTCSWTFKKTFNNFLSLNHFPEDLFDKKVELATTQSMSPYIGPHILKTVEYVSVAS
jgi:uncharacterized protein